MDHLPDKEPRKRKPKKTFEIDFGDDVNFDTYFRTTRVRTITASVVPYTAYSLLDRYVIRAAKMN